SIDWPALEAQGKPIRSSPTRGQTEDQDSANDRWFQSALDRARVEPPQRSSQPAPLRGSAASHGAALTCPQTLVGCSPAIHASVPRPWHGFERQVVRRATPRSAAIARSTVPAARSLLKVAKSCATRLQAERPWADSARRTNHFEARWPAPGMPGRAFGAIAPAPRPV